MRLASFPSAGATLVTEAVSLYRAALPEVELSLTEGEPHETVPRLKRGDFDVAVVFEDSPRAAAASCSTGLDCVHLLDDPLCVVLPADHPLAAARRCGSSRLAGEPGSPAAAAASAPTCWWTPARGESFTPNVAFESDDHNVLVGLVATGVGVALLPELVPADAARRGRRSARCPGRSRCADLRRGARRRLPLARHRGDDRGPEHGQRALRSRRPGPPRPNS